MTLSLKQQYGLITANYWGYTITDGALRMLVLLHFYQLGYSPLEIAMLFLFYEFFGIVTNLFGGWFGARLGLNLTMNIGLGLQMVALMMLTVSPEWLTVAYVMLAQALSGIAKDLNKMSAKSAIKSLTTDGDGQLYRWVALLTGSKNALKGVGFFVGAALLGAVGFQYALYVLTALILVPFILSVLWLDSQLGRAKNKPKFTEMFSKSPAINWLSAARFFLFGARDVWFVVALPVFLQGVLGWSHLQVGTFMALWVIGYGVVQATTPRWTGLRKGASGVNPTHWTAMKLALLLAATTAIMAFMMDVSPETVLIGGLVVFGVVFALNSAVHSYLIVSYADADGTSKDVGFYYMANAGGRLMGTLLSGWIYQAWGMDATLWVSALMVLMAALLVARIRPEASASV